MLTSVLGLSLGFGFTKGLFLVSVSDLVSFSFFSESRIQYRIRLGLGMIPDSDSSTQNLVPPTSAKPLLNLHSKTIMQSLNILTESVLPIIWLLFQTSHLTATPIHKGSSLEILTF